MEIIIFILYLLALAAFVFRFIRLLRTKDDTGRKHILLMWRAYLLWFFLMLGVAMLDLSLLWLVPVNLFILVVFLIFAYRGCVELRRIKRQ